MYIPSYFFFSLPFLCLSTTYDVRVQKVGGGWIPIEKYYEGMGRIGTLTRPVFIYNVGQTGVRKMEVDLLLKT